VDVVEGSDQHGDPCAGNGQPLRAEAPGLRSRPGSRSGEAEVKLAVSRRQVPDGGGEEAPRCEVVGWERHPGGRVGRIGDEAAVELVQRISETLQVCLVTVGRDIDVEGA
jgi:hypothetical protein